MKNEVGMAIKQIQDYFPSGEVEIKEDGQGGAYVVVHTVDLGPLYTEETRKTWMGFHLPYNLPMADIYPHHVRPDLALAGGGALPRGMHLNRTFEGFNRPSVMFSRRTKLKHAVCQQTALDKLLKIVEWAGGDMQRCAA